MQSSSAAQVRTRHSTPAPAAATPPRRAGAADGGPAQAASQALRYARRAYRDRRWPDRMKQLLRWPALAALRPRESIDWFQRCEQPDLRPLLQRQPHLALKPLRPYVSVRWDRARRARVILDSCEFLLSGPAPLRDALLRPEGRVLATAVLGQGETLELHLGSQFRFRKEGELVLTLRAGPEGRAVASAALAFECTVSGSWRAYIGCLQGAPEARAQHGRLTKAAHGLRPQALLIFVAQEIARALRLEALLAVGEEIHVHRSKHLLRVPGGRRLRFDYERLWLEAGAQRMPDGWYALPLRARRRARGEQPAHKRAMYERRYALMDDIAQRVALGLHAGSFPASRPQAVAPAGS